VRTKHFALLAFLLAVGLAFNTLHVKLAHASAFRSFLVTVTESTFESDSPGPVPVTVQWAVRADGSYAYVLPNPTNSPSPTREVTDFQTGLDVRVTPEVQAITTTKLSKLAKRYGPATDCSETFMGHVVSPAAPAGQILGFDVDMTDMKDNDIPAGAWGPMPKRTETKTWMAPALGCFVLRKEWHTDKLLSSGWVKDWINVEQAVAVSFVLVDQYFYVPPTYTEMSLVDVLVKLHESSPSLHPLPTAAEIQMFNASYYKNRP
jgi:hypothetical protein